MEEKLDEAALLERDVARLRSQINKYRAGSRDASRLEHEASWKTSRIIQLRKDSPLGKLTRMDS